VVFLSDARLKYGLQMHNAREVKKEERTTLSFFSSNVSRSISVIRTHMYATQPVQLQCRIFASPGVEKCLN
jgi:hypothetical protein